MGKRVGSSYTSDLTPDGIAQMLDAAFEIGEITTEDPFAGLPDAGDLGKLDGDLQLYSEDIDSLSTEQKIELARRAEAAALPSIRASPTPKARRSTPSPGGTCSPIRWALRESIAAVTARSACAGRETRHGHGARLLAFFSRDDLRGSNRPKKWDASRRSAPSGGWAR